MKKTSVVILNWNGLPFLKKFLGITARHTIGNDTSLYVADNGSTDGSIKWISENFSDIGIIELGKNYGFAEGYNRALKQVESRYYVLLNSDVEVTENWLVPLVSYMDNNLDVASCQPKILSFNKRDHFEYAGAAGGFLDKYGYPFCRGRLFNITEKDNGQYDDTRNVFWSSGACMIVRTEAWKKMEGFDELFFAHMEEIDLCWRFQNSGLRVCCLPVSAVYHVGGGALNYESPFKTYLNFRNSLYLLYKNLPDNKLNRVLFLRRLLDGIAALYFLVKGQSKHTKSVWKAHMDFYRNKKRIRVKRRHLRNIMITDSQAYILNKSVVFQFYILGNKTYKSLNSAL